MPSGAKARPISSSECTGLSPYPSKPEIESLVPKKGLEPPHPCEYMDLNHARLPIPPLRLTTIRCPPHPPREALVFQTPPLLSIRTLRE